MTIRIYSAKEACSEQEIEGRFDEFKFVKVYLNYSRMEFFYRK